MATKKKDTKANGGAQDKPAPKFGPAESKSTPHKDMKAAKAAVIKFLDDCDATDRINLELFNTAAGEVHVSVSRRKQL